MRTRYVRVHGRDIRVLEAGTPPEDGREPAVVVLIHGLAGGAETWRPVLEAWDDRVSGHVLIAPDLIGHQNADYSLGGYANEIRDLLAALGHRRASIVGHSPRWRDSPAVLLPVPAVL